VAMPYMLPSRSQDIHCPLALPCCETYSIRQALFAAATIISHQQMRSPDCRIRLLPPAHMVHHPQTQFRWLVHAPPQHFSAA